MAVLGVLGSVSVPLPANAFTQSGAALGSFGNSIPMGHEWLNRKAAIELLLPGADPVVPNDPHDPRKSWVSGVGLAKNLDLSKAGAEVTRIMATPYNDSRYASQYKLIFDTILGERWVDLAGFDVSREMLGSGDCFDAVAQEPVEVQYDHFMRQYDDAGPKGGVNAATQSQRRFIQYFVDAAMAPPTNMLMWDGGASYTQYTVDRNYFLFGRAVHLFEDSFSLEHTVRTYTDNYTTIKQVKSYLCALGSEQHTHANAAIADYTSGDVIWLPGTRFAGGSAWSTYLPSFMKSSSLVALEATKDLFAAWIRTMATPLAQRKVKAQNEAQTLVNNWLSFDQNTMMTWYVDPADKDATYVRNDGEQGPGQAQSTCMIGLGQADGSQANKVAALQATQRNCLYVISAVEGYTDLFDTSTHMPFYWNYTASSFQTVPPNWSFPTRPADTGLRVYLKNVQTGYPLSGALANNQQLRAIGADNVGFIQLPTLDSTAYLFRAAFDPTLFLSYNAGADGTVKLWQGTNQSSFTLIPTGWGQAVMNVYWKQYLWADDNGNVYLTSAGDPMHVRAQWQVINNAF
jgi:hypothetical protein